jgi:anti-sigma B factor antagonist
MPDLAASFPTSPCPPGSLRIAHRETQSGWCVVSVEGDVDLASAPALKSALVALLVGRSHRRFVLDLSRLGHLDSTGLGVLAAFRQRLGADGTLKLAGMPPNLLSVLRLSGLDRAFEICADVDADVSRGDADVEVSRGDADVEVSRGDADVEVSRGDADLSGRSGTLL